MGFAAWAGNHGVGYLDGSILGKPEDSAEARSMLRSLSGRTHEVMTGVSVSLGDRSVTQVVTTLRGALPYRSGFRHRGAADPQRLTPSPPVPFAAAISTHPDPAVAIGEVVGSVLEQLGDTPDVSSPVRLRWSRHRPRG